jgi:hypothetical protein
MSRISDQVLDSVVYLYKSADSARKGESLGGSGFMVGVPSERIEGQAHCYAVTNLHVINQGFRVVRMTTATGEADVLDLSEDEWVAHPNGDDVAVCPIARPATEALALVSTAAFLPREAVPVLSIGPGDDIYMVGRFIGHDGRQRNTPIVRVGVISMMPSEPVLNSNTGLYQESILVETHSITGHSGSPVFVQRPPMTRVPGEPGLRMYHREWFLGIDWGHIPHFDDVVDEGGKRHPDGWRVKSNSAIAAVVPAWKLNDLLNVQQLVNQRAMEDIRLATELASSGNDVLQT